ncbi:MAG: hypothetical protein QGM50_03990 [Anaerolineae bacterium]|nr:hypothetical protein [Anaerolineae bacterium]MDK1117934.1 hypothetical protein [Anaerolineae bacterium]
MNNSSQTQILPFRKMFIVALILIIITFSVFKVFPNLGARIISLEIALLTSYFLITWRASKSAAKHKKQDKKGGIDFEVY